MITPAEIQREQDHEDHVLYVKAEAHVDATLRQKWEPNGVVSEVCVQLPNGTTLRVVRNLMTAYRKHGWVVRIEVGLDVGILYFKAATDAAGR